MAETAGGLDVREAHSHERAGGVRPLRGTEPGRVVEDSLLNAPTSSAIVAIHGAALPCGEAQVVWIADTGSANHLCSKETLPSDVFEGTRPCPDVRLATANGIIEPEGQLNVKVFLPVLGVDARFWAPRDCPPVLSIGRLALGGRTGLPFPLAERQGLVRGSRCKTSQMRGQEFILCRTSAFLHHHRRLALWLRRFPTARRRTLRRPASR